MAICLGRWLGTWLRLHLPDEHLKDDSKDILKTASGMVATLVALVIGLLVSSAKSTFDQAASGLTQVATRTVLLDRKLRLCGSTAAPARAQLLASHREIRNRIWPASGQGSLEATIGSVGMGQVQTGIDAIATANDAERDHKKAASDAFDDLVQAQLATVEQAELDLPPALLVVLICWLTVLFVGLGVLCPRNPTATVSLMVAALAMAAAVFLLIELSHPFAGVIQVPHAPLDRAIELISLTHMG